MPHRMVELPANPKKVLYAVRFVMNDGRRTCVL